MTDLFRWPSGVLPHFPLNDSYQVTRPNLLQRTQLEQGAPRQRSVFKSGVRQYAITWALDPIQYAIFDGILRHDLDDGAAWFIAPVFDGVDYTDRQVRFVKDSFQPDQRSGGEWMVSFQWETLDEVPPDLTTTGVLMLTWRTDTDLATLVALFDAALHTGYRGIFAA